LYGDVGDDGAAVDVRASGITRFSGRRRVCFCCWCPRRPRWCTSGVDSGCGCIDRFQRRTRPARRRIAAALDTHAFHLVVLILIFLDVAAVVAETMLSFVCEMDDADPKIQRVKAWEQILGWTSRTILLALMGVQVVLMLCHGWRYFTRFFYLLDLCVLVVALALEFTLASHQARFLAILLSWRVVRILHGLVAELEISGTARRQEKLPRTRLHRLGALALKHAALHEEECYVIQSETDTSEDDDGGSGRRAAASGATWGDTEPADGERRRRRWVWWLRGRRDEKGTQAGSIGIGPDRLRVAECGTAMDTDAGSMHLVYAKGQWTEHHDPPGTRLGSMRGQGVASAQTPVSASPASWLSAPPPASALLRQGQQYLGTSPHASASLASTSINAGDASLCGLRGRAVGGDPTSDSSGECSPASPFLVSFSTPLADLLLMPPPTTTSRNDAASNAKMAAVGVAHASVEA
jgi:hypothetical protein